MTTRIKDKRLTKLLSGPILAAFWVLMLVIILKSNPLT